MKSLTCVLANLIVGRQDRGGGAVVARDGGAYVVRDESAGGGSGNVDKLYPYTLKGLTDALEEARYRSYAGPPQVVMTMAEGGMRLIRRYERGREAPAEAPR
jgi:hypothetical protein